MNPFTNISKISVSGMRAQSYRLQLSAENLANADTYGYKRKLAVFGTHVDRASGRNEVEIARVMLDRREGEQVYEPTHPFADDNGYVEKSNVDLITEFADAREANRSYEAGLEVLQQAKRMYSSLLDILRR